MLNGETITVKPTTNHPMSSYNQPVWADKFGNCYGQCNLGLPVGYELVLERKILITWLKDDSVELFSSLAPFFKKYPDYKKHKANIETYLSRKNQPFENEEIRLQRVDVQK